MDKLDLARKAKVLLGLHQGKEPLLLPNIWDPLGARLLEDLGFPAVATASAAVAWSHACEDGQVMAFETMLQAIQRIAAAVEVPLTADIEAGFAAEPAALAENMRAVLGAGAVGINLEDTDHAAGGLYAIERQCARIAAVRDMAAAEGVHLVINGRIDVLLQGAGREREALLAETIERGKAYRSAGADCLYPIGYGDVAQLTELQRALRAPLNVFASARTASLAELRAIGISRVSLGPGLLKTSLAAVKRAVIALPGEGSYEVFTRARAASRWSPSSFAA